MARRALDEDDIRVRPGRSKSRPRSKDRPTHPTAVSGLVVGVDRGRFTVDLDVGEEVHAIKSREVPSLVVGDRVGIVGDVSGAGHARIVRRDPRTTTLRRTADDIDPVERVIVANATQLAVVTATVQPEPRVGLIDRALVAAYDAGIRPLLVITKTDLHPADELLALYGPLDMPIVTIADKVVPADLLALLADEVTVLIGHSGVGKSTLVNSLVPEAERTTGAVNDVTGRGRHTSTSVAALRLPQGGYVIDTPGVRTFGLAHVDPDRVVHAFEDLAALADRCPRGCTHDEPECALDEDPSPATVSRVASLRRLIRSRDAAGDGRT